MPADVGVLRLTVFDGVIAEDDICAVERDIVAVLESSVLQTILAFYYRSIAVDALHIAELYR